MSIMTSSFDTTSRLTKAASRQGLAHLVMAIALGLIVLGMSALVTGGNRLSLPTAEQSEIHIAASATGASLDSGSSTSFFSGDAKTRSRGRDPDPIIVPWQTAAADAEEQLSLSEKVNLRLTYRYQNPVTVRFLRTMSTDRGLRWYSEASQLIDTRHLQPSSYESRVRQAATNLWYAVENPAFLEAHGLRLSQQQIDAYRSALRDLVRGRTVRDSRDAMNMLSWIADLGNRHLRLPATTVALEFVYGAAESLDKYSTFVPEDVAQQPSADLEDHVVGIGVEVKLHEEGLRIERVVPGTPASDAGLQSGDIIVSVNGNRLAGKSLDYAVDLITGPVGSQVLLGVRRDEQSTSLVTLTRRRVPVHSVVDVKMIDEEAKTGYLRLTKFAQSSSAEMDKALWTLHRQGMQSLIIDLRGNPGGLLTTAIEISNKFLPCGTIVSTRGRQTLDDSLERATYERTWKVPLVVLVDGDSASASEIFAAAIQDNQRGLIVGRRSYGKGTVQTHFPMQTVSGNLKLTTARFYSPSGRAMADAGVEPDVPVVLVSAELNSTSEHDADIQAAVATAQSQQLLDLAAQAARCPAGTDNTWRVHVR